MENIILIKIYSLFSIEYSCFFEIGFKYHLQDIECRRFWILTMEFMNFSHSPRKNCKSKRKIFRNLDPDFVSSLFINKYDNVISLDAIELIDYIKVWRDILWFEWIKYRESSKNIFIWYFEFDCESSSLSTLLIEVSAGLLQWTRFKINFYKMLSCSMLMNSIFEHYFQ